MSPLWLSLILFITIALGVFALSVSIGQLLGGHRRIVGRRLVPDRDVPATPSITFEPEPKVSQGITGRIDRAFAQLIAGSGVQLEPGIALLLTLICGILCGAGLFLWREDLLVSAAGLILGMLLVIVIFFVLQHRRRQSMREQLPEAISLLARAVRAGETLEQALEMVGTYSRGNPLGREFRRVAQQLDMGLSVDGAMRALTTRVPLVEMQILAATISVQRRAGGPLPEALESLEKVIRDRLNYYRQFRAATAGARTSSLVVAAAGPAIAAYMFVWQPEYIQKFATFPQGKTLLLVAVVLLITGVSWVYRLLKPEY